MERAMEEAKYLAQQQQLMLQQHHLQQQQQQHHLQQHQHQQMLLLQQQIQQQQQQQQQQAAALSRFPSNPLGSFRRPLQPQSQQQQQIPLINPNPISNHPLISNHPQNPNPNLIPNPGASSAAAVPALNRNPAETQMAYQDLWKVCHPDYKTPFSSLEDACERLLPYHVVADYEAEEDDRILDSDTTGQVMSRSQQWDHNIAVKVAEFAETFGKQVCAFNIVNRKRAIGEFRLEERLLIEKLLMQDERQSLLELREELESRQNAGREANLRMAAMVRAEQARAESQAHAEMMTRGPIRPNALGSQGSNFQIGQEIAISQQEVNPEEMINGWGNSAQRDENEPTEDFLNDEETENGDAGMGEFDLNTSTR